MIVHANETTIQAVVKQIVPCADGYGHELELAGAVLDGQRLEPSREPRPGQNQLEIRSQSCSSQVRLQKELFHAVPDLVREPQKLAMATTWKAGPVTE